jgi:tetratricopeptide (TPR) repeat protein
MFLTKKGFLKILIIAILYFVLGSLCITVGMIFRSIDIPANPLLILGLIAYLLCVITIFLGYYAEGKGILINLGNKLVRNELKPMEFIKHYEELKNSTDLVIKKPSAEVLQLVSLAYASLNDIKKTLAVQDEIIEISKEKKKSFAMLQKAAVLFSYGEVEQAEAIFSEMQTQKLDFMSTALADAILKCDRAMAMGDYKTVEAYALGALERKFPKLDNLGRLVFEYRLGEVYEKLQDNQKAVAHYEYCVNFGGETAIKNSAIEKLQNLKSENLS